MLPSANRTGFSLIEVILVLAIMAIVAAVAVPTVDLLQTRERSEATIERMQILKTALESYYEDHLAFPTALDDLSDERYITGAFGEDDAFLDGWGNGFDYEVTGETVTLTSFGIDQMDSDQNIVLSLDGTRFLLSRTRDDLKTIHVALRNYESRRIDDGLPELPTDWYDESDPGDSAMGILVLQGFLPNTARYATDAWGDSYVYTGSPADFVTSSNLD